MTLNRNEQNVRRLRQRLVRLLQRTYRHEQTTALLFRDLAANAGNEPSRVLFLRMASEEQRQLTQFSTLLREIDDLVPSKQERLIDRGWRWIIGTGGPITALTWIRWSKRRLVAQQRQLRHEIEMYLHTQKDE